MAKLYSLIFIFFPLPAVEWLRQIAWEKNKVPGKSRNIIIYFLKIIHQFLNLPKQIPTPLHVLTQLFLTLWGRNYRYLHITYQETDTEILSYLPKVTLC